MEQASTKASAATTTTRNYMLFVMNGSESHIAAANDDAAVKAARARVRQEIDCMVEPVDEPTEFEVEWNLLRAETALPVARATAVARVSPGAEGEDDDLPEPDWYTERNYQRSAEAC